MVDTACRRLRRNLTPEEARQYLGVAPLSDLPELGRRKTFHFHGSLPG